MQPKMMTTTTIMASIVLMVLGTSMLTTAYHIAEPVGPTATDNPATQWIAVQAGFSVFTICESEGPQDKQNPQDGKIRGVNALCYTSSDHSPSTDKGTGEGGSKKDEVPRYDPDDLNNTEPTKWSRITPTCEPINENTNPNGFTGVPAIDFPSNPAIGCPSQGGLGLLGWFAALGIGGQGCAGSWGQSYYYPEFLAWAFGPVAGSNLPGGTGHVSFFVDDDLTAGSYEFRNDIPQGELDDARNAMTNLSPGGIAFCSDTF